MQRTGHILGLAVPFADVLVQSLAQLDQLPPRPALDAVPPARSAVTIQGSKSGSYYGHMQNPANMFAFEAPTYLGADCTMAP